MSGIVWNFDKSCYSPSDILKLSISAINDSNSPICISEVLFRSDFGTYSLQQVSGIIPPSISDSPMPAFLGFVELELPPTVVGTRRYFLSYRIHHFRNGGWDSSYPVASREFGLNIFKTPIYKVFLSRGIHFDDRIIGNPIAQMLREWGLDPSTVGIDIPAPARITPQIIDCEIGNSTGLVAIATPRSIDQSTHTYKTLEWLHGETGMAFARQKPILILKDRDVNLGGLPSYLPPNTQLEFDPYNLNDLKRRLSLAILWFRESIERKNTADFYGNLKNLAIGGLAAFGSAVILGGIFGSLFEDGK
jgi:hypothetical protein